MTIRATVFSVMMTFWFGSWPLRAGINVNPAGCGKIISNENGARLRHNPWAPWLHGMPVGSNIVKIQPTVLEAEMMTRSYQRANSDGPIEVGYVELLDKNGDLIATTGIVNGSNGVVNHLNDRVLDLIKNNFRRVDQIAEVRVGRTHPQWLAGPSLPVATYKFFPDDNLQDDEMRTTLNNLGLTKVIFESFIVYLYPFLPFIDPNGITINHVKVKARRR